MGKIAFIKGKFGASSLPGIKQRLEDKGHEVKILNRKYPKDPEYLCVNWGQTRPHPFNKDVINNPLAVNYYSSKIRFYSLIINHYDDLITEDFKLLRLVKKKGVAEIFLNNGYNIFARQYTSSHGGKGITHHTPGDVLPEAKYYTVGLPHETKAEYFNRYIECRAHVVTDPNGVFWCQKRKMSDTKMQEYGFTYDPYIRSYKNGWVFSYDVDEAVDTESIEEHLVYFVKEFGLDFVAADLIFDKEEECWYLLEINTAPGLDKEKVFDFYTLWMEAKVYYE